MTEDQHQGKLRGMEQRKLILRRELLGYPAVTGMRPEGERGERGLKGGDGRGTAIWRSFMSRNREDNADNKDEEIRNNRNNDFENGKERKYDQSFQK
jgi:hypothetical protein